jgi:hypothetical protein
VRRGRRCVQAGREEDESAHARHSTRGHDGLPGAGDTKIRHWMRRMACILLSPIHASHE